MTRLKKSNFSTQVAEILEKRILSGELPAGKKIPSIRHLANEFGVSQQVIISAFGYIEEKNLLVRHARQGTYVNPEIFAGSKKDVFLLFSKGNSPKNYMRKALSVDDARVWGEMNVIARTVPLPTLSKGELAFELSKIKDQQPDCLVSQSLVSKKLLKSFKGLGFPLVFIGDFPWGLSTQWNQITEDTGERATAFIDAAASSGRRSVVMVGELLDNYFSRVMKSAAEKRAKSNGIKFRYEEYSDQRATTHKEFILSRETCIEHLLSQGRPDCIIFDGFQMADTFLDALSKHGVSLEETQVICDSEQWPGTVFMKTDYSEFATAAEKLIEETIENPAGQIGPVVLSGLIKRVPVQISSLKKE